MNYENAQPQQKQRIRDWLKANAPEDYTNIATITKVFDGTVEIIVKPSEEV
ncbi:hypothetical protein KAR91_17090 [Candidatus Pacearchaeota archaeon]|nr:hypothetical protein [Candidatus Pacearchaeota archaeon]